jgi:Ser/Thr protein kinase RdoA (MazF antagonist)
MAAVDVLETVFDGQSLSEVVLSGYDIGPVQECVLWARSLNDTYLVQADARYALRVYRHGWRDEEDIAYEVDALRHLRQHGCNVADPVPDRLGRYWRVIKGTEGDRYAVVFSWAAGGMPVPESEYARAYGRAAAGLHEASAGFAGRRARTLIDVDELLNRPVQHVMPFLARRPDDARYLRELATSLAIEIQQRSADLESGFCHGDLHGGNAHVTDNGTVTFFDFDSAGPGWRAYDIATYRWATNAMRLEGGRDDCWDDFLTGYREVRDLGVGDLAAVPLFVAARHIWLIGLHAQLTPSIGRMYLSDEAVDRHFRVLRHWQSTA